MKFRFAPKITPRCCCILENGVSGVLTVSQVSAGRKNRLFYEISGSKSSAGVELGAPLTSYGSASALVPTR